MGDSTWRDRYSLDLYVQEAKAAISATNLDRGPVRPIIVGHSFGGFIAHAFASRHPELLSGAILVDYGSTLGEDRAHLPPPRSFRANQYDSLTEALARFRFVPEQDCSNSFIVDYIARRSLTQHNSSGDQWRWKLDPDLVAKFEGEAKAPATDSDCPIAIIWGETSSLITDDVRARWRQRLPDAPFIEIPDAGHQLMVDQPLSFVGGLRGLLAT
jgi:pimeloyl-ACP methyl ester carboxylesterase